MKKNYLFLMMSMLLTLNSWALNKDDKGWYLIGNADDLIEFQELVNNEGENAAKAKLTADIDLSEVENFTPIGLYADQKDRQVNFLGTFDGCGHVIKNLKVNVGERFYEAGLFSRLQGATVCNLGIINAHIVQQNTENTDGGVRAGVIAGEANQSLVENCYTIGEIIIESNHISDQGGIAGEAAGNTPIRNCFTTYEKMVGKAYNNQNSFEAEEVAEYAATGQLCFMLNANEDEPVYFQTLGQDEYPTQDATHAVVYAVGTVNCDGTPAGEVSYSNDNSASNRLPHQYEGGICVNCGHKAVSKMEPAEDGWFEVTNGYELMWLADYVNQGHATTHIRLMNDIDLDDIANFPAIGYYNDNGAQIGYHGTFDGQGHLIYNLHQTMSDGGEAGLFSRVNGGGKLMNFGVINANVVNEAPYRAGVIAGEIHACTVTNVFSAGNLSVSTAHNQTGGISGEAYESTLVNCWSTYDVLADNKVTFRNCYAGSEVYEKMGTGELCYLLNGGDITNPTWFQTIGDDEYPTLDPTHGLVYKIADGDYASATTPDEFAELVATLVDAEIVEWDNADVNIDLKNDMLAALEAMKTLSWEDYLEAVNADDIKKLKSDLQKSAKAYDAYKAKVAEVRTYLNEHPEMTGNMVDQLQDYLGEDAVEPNEEFTLGSYAYILTNLYPTNDEITAETAFVAHMLEVAIIQNCEPNSEITNLLVNPGMNGFDGWKQTHTGTWETGGNGNSSVAYNRDGVFNIYQTLTGVKNGLYEVVVQAGFKGAADLSNTHYAPQLYANSDSVFVMMLAEDISESSLDEETDEDYFDMEGNFGLAPGSKAGAATAFDNGKYVNRIITNVTNDTLTLGIYKPGTGNAGDHVYFSNFKVYYRGTVDDASEALSNVLAGQAARATTMINSIPDTSDPKVSPSFSMALKEQLQSNIDAVATAADGASKYALMQSFEALDTQIKESKAAYMEMVNLLETLYAAYYTLGAENTDYIEQYNEKIWYDVYEAGAYTTEEVYAEIANMKKDEYYHRTVGDEPTEKGGWYGISNPYELIWFANQVNNGNNGIKGELLNDIDLADFVNINPIGLYNDNGVKTPFAGTFDGRNHVIKNLTITRSDGCEAGLFSRISGGTLRNLGVVNATITNEADVRAGVLGGEIHNATLQNCFTAGNIEVSTSHAQAGGIAGEANSTNPTNCYTTYEALAFNYGDGFGPKNCYAGEEVIAMAETGELCYALNGGNVKEPTWRQTLGEDAYPVLDQTHGIVYTCGEYYCDGTLKGDLTYSNTDNNVRDPHEFENGACVNCGSIEAVPDMAEDEYYLISTPDHLKWLSWTVNHGTRDVKARMINDIDMAGVEDFQPIGEYMDKDKDHRFPFKGVFDGCGYEIKNLNIVLDAITEGGLFGRIAEGGTVKNLGIVNVSIVNNDATGARVGGLAGEAHAVTISNCYVIGEINLVTHDSQTAGIAGENAEGKLSNCWTTYKKISNSGVRDNCYYGDDVEAMLATGELCYKLNKGNVADPAWRQTLGTDAYPTAKASNKIVYLAADEASYTNEKPNYVDMAELVAEAEALSASTKEYEKLITDTKQFTSNCQWPNEGSLNNLLDGSHFTFFHSIIDRALETSGEYIQVNLNKPVSSFYLEFAGRGDGEASNNGWHDTPNKIRIEASNNPSDEGSWVVIDTEEYDLPNTHHTVYKATTPTDLGAEYTAVRFYVLHATSGNTYWNVSEFQMYDNSNGNEPIYYSVEGMKALVDAMNELAANGADKVKSDKPGISDAEVAALAAAIEAVKKLKDEATGIIDIAPATPVLKSNAIYTLTGVKVANSAADLKALPKGIYVVGGKKMMVK